MEQKGTNDVPDTFLKIEERLLHSPSIVLQNAPKCVIVFHIRLEGNNMVLDMREPLSPCVHHNADVLDYPQQVRLTVNSRDDLELLRTGQLSMKDAFDLNKVDIDGEEKILRRLGGVFKSIFSKQERLEEEGAQGPIKIIDIVQRKKIVFYRIRYLSSKPVEKRFSEFVSLHKAMRNQGRLPKLPPKGFSMLQGRSSDFLLSRSQKLECYLNDLLAFVCEKAATREGKPDKSRLLRFVGHVPNQPAGPPSPVRRKLSYYDDEALPAGDNATNTEGRVASNDRNHGPDENEMIQRRLDQQAEQFESATYAHAFRDASLLLSAGPLALDSVFWAIVGRSAYKGIAALVSSLFGRKKQLWNVLWEVAVTIGLYNARKHFISLPVSNVVKREAKFLYSSFTIIAGYKIAKQMASRLKKEERSGWWKYVNQRFAIVAYLTMAELGGMIMKAGQYMGARSDVVPPVYVQELSKLQDQGVGRPYSEIKMQLQTAFGKLPLDSIFSEFNREPLAAASIAQVHKARLKSTRRQVAVKIQHKGIESIMRADMYALTWVTWFIARAEPEYDFGPIMKEWRTEAVKELDFNRERENIEIVAKGLRESTTTDVIVPEPINISDNQSISSKYVIVLEFSDGVKVTNLKALREHNVDLGRLLKEITKAFGEQMFKIGVFSGDPHPGNILVELPTVEDGRRIPAKPVLLDFGLAKRLSNKIRLGFCKLVVASAQKDYFMLLEAFDEVGVRLNRSDAQSDMDIIRFLFRDTAPSKSARKRQNKMRKVLEAKKKARREANIVPPVRAFPGDLLFFLRAQDLLRGLCSTLEVVQSPLKIFYKIAREALFNSRQKNDCLELREMSSQHLGQHKFRKLNSILVKDLKRALEDMVSTEVIAGCQCAVVQGGFIVADVTAGHQNSKGPSQQVQPYSLFNSFSCTKAFTATALHLLVQDGLIASYDDLVIKYWPEFGEKHPDLTISHLLTHRARMQHAMPEKITFEQFCDFDYMCTAMCDIPSDKKTEEELQDSKVGQYHYLSFGWLVGGLVHAVSGQSFQEFVTSRIFRPLHLETEAMIGVQKDWLEPESVHYSRLATLDPSNMVEGGNNNRDDSDGVDIGELDQITERISAGVEKLKTSFDGKKKNSSVKQLLEDLKTKSFLFDMKVYNSKKVRHSVIPAANGHFSARAIAMFYDLLAPTANMRTGTSPLLSSATIANATQITHSFAKFQVEDGHEMESEFGLGYRRFGFSVDNAKTKYAFGHGGVGGSMGMSIPHAGVTIGLTVNRLQRKSIVFKRVLDVLQSHFPEVGTPTFFMGDNLPASS